MADSCATCFFYRSVNDSARGECHLSPPRVVSSGLGSSDRWPGVLPTEWCGDGIDGKSAVPFIPAAQSPPA